MARWQDVINPIKWFAYLNGMALKEREAELALPHIVEQNMYRRLRCPQCLVVDNHPNYPGKAVCIGNPNCEGCTCDTWGKMLLAEEACHCGKWGPYRTVDEWEEYKKKFDIKFLLQFIGKIL